MLGDIVFYKVPEMASSKLGVAKGKDVAAMVVREFTTGEANLLVFLPTGITHSVMYVKPGTAGTPGTYRARD